jgi:hydrogenase nickel incorporation protein HypA/HybF
LFALTETRVGQDPRNVVHELALIESLIDTVEEQVKDARVWTVCLEVGRQACAAPEALKFCFEVCTRGTSLEGAKLEVVEVEGQVLRIREVEVS